MFRLAHRLPRGFLFDYHQPALLLTMKRLRNAVNTVVEATALPRMGRGKKRSAVTAMELLLVTPLLLIFLMAVIQFGVILANLKYLPLASRAGAKVLAETPPANLTSAATFTNVKNAVSAVLATGNIFSCVVILEQNVNATTMPTDPVAPCPCAAPSLPVLPVVSTVKAVRVTVCVPWSELAHNVNFLSLICFSLSDRTSQSSTLYPYERFP